MANYEYLGISQDEAEEILKNRSDMRLYMDRLEPYMDDDEMDNESLGILFRMLFEYSRTGKVLECKDRYIRTAFKVIQKGMDIGNQKYIETTLRNRSNGSKGGRPKNQNKPSETESNPVGYTETQTNPFGSIETQNNPVGFLKTQLNPLEPRETHTDTYTDTETDTNTDNDTHTEKDSKGETILQSFDEAYSFLRTIEPNYHVSGRDHNLLSGKIQNDYKNGIRYSESELDKFAKNAPSICQRIIDSQRGNRII